MWGWCQRTAAGWVVAWWWLRAQGGMREKMRDCGMAKQRTMLIRV